MNPEARARWLVALSLIGTGALVTWGILHFEISLADPDALAESVRATGAFAPLLLIALLVVQSVVAPLPSQPVLMAAGFVYGPWLGLAIGWVGVLLGAIACFGIARLLGRPAVGYFVSAERLSAVDDYVSARGLRRTFVALSRQIGLRGPTDSHGPRLHDFRHRFAVEVLLRWYREGVDVERHLPELSTYLGHVKVSDTYYYLSATPELLQLALNRLESSQPQGVCS